MEVSSPQLAQAVAAARIALAEAFVAKIGQTLQAVVAGQASDGLTLLKIGDQIVKAALPEGLPPGTTLQLLVKSAGPAPQLAIVAQSPPRGQAPVASPPVDVRPLVLPPVAAEPATVQKPAGQQNSELRQPVGQAPSQIESRAAVVTVPEPRPVGGQQVQIAPTNLGPARAELPPVPQAIVARPSLAEGQQPPTPAAPARMISPAPSAPPVSGVTRASATIPPMPAPAMAGQPSAVAAAPTSPGLSLISAEPAPPAPPPSPAAPPQVQAPPTGPSTAPAAQAQTAVSVPAAVSESEAVHPLLVAQAAPRPAVTAAELPRAVAAPTPLPQSSPIAPPPAPATPQAALAQMLPEVLAKQNSAAPLLQSLASLVQKPAILPEPILRAALGVLAQRVVATDGKVQAADLERAVLRSGVGLEATLARGETPAPLDAKAGLLALRAALTKWLGDGPPAAMAPRETAPPPLKGLPLRAPELDMPALPEAPRDALRAVHGQADAAVSRMKLMQLASLPDADPTRPQAPALRLELPLLIGHELVMAQLQVSRDGARRDAERKRGWTMRFALNYSATGEVGAEIGLLGKAVNVALWAAEPATAEAMQSALPELGGALEAIGLKPGALRIRHGAPEPAKPSAGQLLDSVS